MMGNNDGSRIRIELNTNKSTEAQYRDYMEALREYVMSDSMMHAKARLELLETIVHTIMDEYGCTPNQMRIIEERFSVSGEPKVWIEVDQNITPIYVLVNGDKEPLKAQKSEEKEDVWHLGM